MKIKQRIRIALAVLFLFKSSFVFAGSVHYAYDVDTQLIKADYSSNQISYQYDKNNNMTECILGKQFSWLMFLPAIVSNNQQQIQLNNTQAGKYVLKK